MARVSPRFSIVLAILLVATGCSGAPPAATPGPTQPPATPPAATPTPGSATPILSGAPRTVAPPTSTPEATPTLAPPTATPVATPPVATPTVAPPTVAPPTVAPPTVAPPTVAPPTASPSPSAEPQTVVTSEDGNLTLSVPTAAIPPGVQIKIVKHGPADLPPELAKARFNVNFYELQPDGTKFSAPVTLSQRYKTSVWAGHIRPSALALRNSKGKWEWAQNGSFAVTDEFTYVTGQTTHFSDVLVFGGNAELASSVPSVNVVGTPFAATWNFTTPAGVAPRNISFAEDVDFMSDPEGRVVENSDDFSKQNQNYSTALTCMNEGPATLVFSARTADALSEAFYSQTLKLDQLTLDVGARLTTTCVAPGTHVATVNQICLQVKHTKLGEFLSYIAFGMVVNGDDIDYIEVTIIGANDDKPQKLTLSPEGYWEEKFGLHGTGDKTILNVTVHWSDGSTQDITQQTIDDLGTDTFTVRFPEEDTFGVCPLG